MDTILGALVWAMVFVVAFAGYKLLMWFFTAYETSGIREEIDENRRGYMSRRAHFFKPTDAEERDRNIEQSIAGK